jgi:membrane protein
MLVSTARAVVDEAREKNVAFVAAGIAYYATVSVVPLLALALAIVSAVGATDTLLTALRAALPSEADAVVSAVPPTAPGGGLVGVVSSLVLLWSGIRVFRGLSVAFSALYEPRADLSLLAQVGRSLLALALLAVAVAALSTTGVLVGYADIRLPAPALLGNAVAVVALVVTFLPLYYVLPPVPVSVSHAVPGAVFAAVAWVLLQFGFVYYTRYAGTYAAYGVLGAVFLFVTFLYFAAVVFLLGAVLNVVLGRR